MLVGKPEIKEYLNLGCGRRFHPDWTNVDFAPSHTTVLQQNLLEGIAFDAETFRVVYHSHLLEHFPKELALPFLRDCYRVLKPNGIIRIAVPDLESLAALYLEAVQKAASGDVQWQHHYEWLLLELYDQVVREASGGDMLAYLTQPAIPNKDFILSRGGGESRILLEQAARQRTLQLPRDDTDTLPFLLRQMRSIYRIVRYPAVRREWYLRRILGNDYQLLRVALFRRSGEIHRWMYDRYSLARLLCEAGFSNSQVHGPSDSKISNWTDYNLDTAQDGTVYKPNSLYMEAERS